MLRRLLATMAAALALAACAALKTAETPAQKAYALYGTFVAVEEAAADLVVQPSTPAHVKAAIKKADAVAKPAADAMVQAARTYVSAKAEIDRIRQSGLAPPIEKLRIVESALLSLEGAIRTAEPQILRLKAAVDSVR
jgi:hypothetical protein